MNSRQNIKETVAIQRRYEVKYFTPVRRAIRSEINSTIAVLKARGIDTAINHVNAHIHSGSIATIIDKLYQEVGLRFARRTWIDLQKRRRMAQKGFGFNFQWVQFIKDYLYQHLIEKITFEVAETTRRILLTTLNRAVSEGWGLDKTVKQLEELPLDKTQAARIVRTETTRAVNTGVAAAGSTFEFEQTKEWIAVHDKRTRGVDPNDHASHIALDGVTIDESELFTDPRNGDKLRYPGDPEATAASTVNCRCNMSLIPKVDQNGRLIPKKKINESIPI